MSKSKAVSVERRVSSEILDRLPPQNLDAECGVLGSILLLSTVLDEIAPILRAEDFYADANQRLYRHMLAMHDEGKKIDTLLLVDRLKQQGDFDAIGGAAYLAQVAQSSPCASNARHYAELVLKTARLRGIIHATTETLRDAYSPDAQPDELLDGTEAALSNVRTGDYQNAPMTAAQAAEAVLLDIDRVCERHEQVGLFTGLPMLDEDIGGLFPGELTILAARPSVGKTALALQIADYSAAHNRLVYFASLEMGYRELARRTICNLAGVNGRVLRTGTIGKDDRRALSNGATTFSQRAIRIDDRPGMTVYDIRRAVRRLAKEGLRLIVVDYLQLLTPEDRRVQRYEQVGQQTKALKELARELEVPVLCLCQLNRASEQQETPMLSNLRESGSIEQDADMVLLLHRPAGGIQISEGETKKKKERAPWPAELIVAKNRNGEQVTVKLAWEPQFTRFSCWEDAGPDSNAAEQSF